MRVKRYIDKAKDTFEIVEIDDELFEILEYLKKHITDELKEIKGKIGALQPIP